MPRGGITLPFLSSRCCCWKRNWKLNFHQDITIYQSRLLVVGGTKLRKSLMNTHLSIFSTTRHLFGGHGVMPSNSLWSQMGSKRNIEGKSMNELKEKSHGLIKHKTGLRWHRKWVGTLSNIITLDWWYSWRDYMLLTGTLCPQFSSQWLHYMLQMGTQCLHYSAHTMLIIDTQCPYYHCPRRPINMAWRAFCTIERTHIPNLLTFYKYGGAYRCRQRGSITGE